MKAPLIGLGVSALCILLSFGLCGASGSAHDTNSSNSLVYAGLACLVVGIVGAGICFIWLLVALIRGKS